MPSRSGAIAVAASRMLLMALWAGCALSLGAAESPAQEKELKGLSFIEKVISPGAEPVYQVDGYRVQIVAGTDKTFKDSIKSVADVHPGSWIRFAGKRAADGTLVAERATFYPDKSAPKHSDTLPGETAAPSTESLIDSQGNFKPLHTKVRLSDAGGWCGWHKLPPEGEQQARVRRIGNRLVPAYLNRMAESQEIPRFRFFVVEENVIRSELACSPGLVLIPMSVLDRSKTDDELATVLAQGIAYNVQYLRARLIARDGWMRAAEVADFATWAVNPIAGLAANGAVGLAAHEHNVELELERGRLALSMMTDAGYDPWQAPETWKLLGSKHLPRDFSSLKYPRIGQYQLMVLEAQYKRHGAVTPQVRAGSGDPAK